MRKLTFAFFILLFSGSFLMLNAQEVGHLNTLEVIDALPAKKQADETLIEKKKKFEVEITRQKAELEKIYTDAQSKITPNTSKEEIQKIQVSLQEKEKRLVDYQKTANDSLIKEREVLYTPIFNGLKDAINTISVRKGLKYVLDSSSESVILYANGIDITKDVMKEMGI